MDLSVCLRNAPARTVVDVGRRVEEHGYRALWLPDGARGAGADTDGRLIGRDAFCSLAALLAQTSMLRAAVGVAAMPMHTVPSLALMASTLNELSGGRFELGIGVSHPELAAHHDRPYPDRPTESMRTAVTELRALSTGGTAFGGGWPVLLAALGPRMVDTAIAAADGAVLNWLTPDGAAAVVARANAAGAPPIRTVLYVRLMEPVAARQDATDYDRLTNYHRHFAAQGLAGADEIAAATTMPADDVARARDQLARYREAGVDEVCLYPVGLSDDVRDRLVASLAP